VKRAQLAFDLPYAPSWDETEFYPTPQNERALGLVKQWPDWQAPAAIVHGAPQSGKTYLAKIWQSRSKASFIEPQALAGHVWAEPFAPLVIEEIDTAAFDETALFHHLNLAREHGSYILLTGQTAPGQWSLTLPDLRSRIRSYPAIEIQPPDEKQLSAMLVKHFDERQIEVAPDVIPYLVARMERSMAAAKQVTAHIDKFALAERRKTKISRIFAAKVFKTFDQEESSGNSNKNDNDCSV
jgi:chromosomal replication initiation ATPase DnaA